MVRRGAIVAGALLAFGAAAAYESSRLPFGTIHNPGPGFFPWWTSVSLNLLALILLAQSLTSSRGTSGQGPGRIMKVGALLMALAAYAFFLEPLGYTLCTFLLLLFMLRVTDPQRWTLALTMSAIAAAGSYILFAVWLSVPLPPGPFSR